MSPHILLFLLQDTPSFLGYLHILVSLYINETHISYCTKRCPKVNCSCYPLATSTIPIHCQSREVTYSHPSGSLGSSLLTGCNLQYQRSWVLYNYIGYPTAECPVHAHFLVSFCPIEGQNLIQRRMAAREENME